MEPIDYTVTTPAAIRYYYFDDIDFNLIPGQTFEYRAKSRAPDNEVPIGGGAKIRVANNDGSDKTGLVLSESYPYLVGGEKKEAWWIFTYQNVSENPISGMFDFCLVCQTNAVRV